MTEPEGKPITGKLIVQQQSEAKSSEFQIVNGYVQGIGEKVIRDFTRVLEDKGMLDETGRVKR